MKTVLYLNHTAVPGGTEFALKRLLADMDRTQVTPVVLFGEDGPAVKLLHESGVETHVLPLAGRVRDVRKDSLGGGRLLNPGRVGAFAAYAGRVARFARERGVDVIHTNSMKAHFYGTLAGKLSGLPVVWHIRDFVNESYLPGAAVKAIRFLARRGPARIVTVSRSVLEQLHLPAGSAKGIAIHDGLGSEEMKKYARGLQTPVTGAEIRVGIVGRLMPWKGQHIFLEAAAQLLKSGARAHFSVVGAPFFGEEAYEQELHRTADRLGIADRVEFLGFQKDIPAVLRGLDILVHASTSPDPCPNAVLEGLAAGVPVIGSNGGGVPEIITHGETGLLHPMGDSGALARTIAELLDNPARAQRIGQAGYAHVRANFTSRRTASRVEEVYSALPTRRHAADTPVKGDTHAARDCS